MQMWKVHVRHVQASSEERNEAESETDHETDEVELSPVHKVSLRRGIGGRVCFGVGVLETSGALRTSMRRSARPGFSRISPSRMTHIRESLCLATVSSALCRSGSRAKRSAPAMR